MLINYYFTTFIQFEIKITFHLYNNVKYIIRITFYLSIVTTVFDNQIITITPLTTYLILLFVFTRFQNEFTRLPTLTTACLLT